MNSSVSVRSRSNCACALAGPPVSNGQGRKWTTRPTNQSYMRGTMTAMSRKPPHILAKTIQHAHPHLYREHRRRTVAAIPDVTSR
jgi:hypothetical protein